MCARVLADRLRTVWGQPVVVENKPGAGGNIAAASVAKAPPDGYTLLMAALSLVTAPFLVKNLGFDPMRDLTPVIEVMSYPMVLVVNSKVPVNNLQELVTYAKKHPGEVTYSSAGVGNTSHLAPALFAHRANIEMTHVPFGGAAQAQMALVNGEVKITFNNPMATVAGARAGQYRAIAVTGANRWRDLPDVPTVAEQGFPGFEASSWLGLLAPTGTPDAILERIEQDVQKIVADKEVSEKLSSAGFEIRNRGRAEYRRQMEADTALWGNFIRDAKIQID
jgi:tripartite-type tricarboxylate transporter receptor subunit TctC